MVLFIASIILSYCLFEGEKSPSNLMFRYGNVVVVSGFCPVPKWVMCSGNSLPTVGRGECPKFWARTTGDWQKCGWTTIFNSGNALETNICPKKLQLK